MPRRLPLVVAVLLAVPLISASGAASLVSASRWQVVKRFDSEFSSGQNQAVAVLGPGDVWVTDGRIHHWNGRRWRTVRPKAAGREKFAGVFGAGRRVWFVTRPDPTFQNVRLLGFDGRRWSWAPEPRREGLSQNVGAPVALPGGDVWWPGNSAVSDGRGGIWTASNTHLAHYSSGRWTTTRTPPGTDRITLARTPGSTTIWALAISYEHSTLLRLRG